MSQPDAAPAPVPYAGDIERDGAVRSEGTAMSNTHGFGHGVSGGALRALLAEAGRCPGCAGTRRQWCLHTRASVPCARCAGGRLAPVARVGAAGLVSLGRRTVEPVVALAAD